MSEEDLKSEKRIKSLVDETKSIVKSFDKNNDGEVDLINAIDGLRELMQNNSELLNERSKEYNQNFIQQLVRLSNYIEDKKRNIQKLYLLVNEILDGAEIGEYDELFWISDERGRRTIIYDDINEER